MSEEQDEQQAFYTIQTKKDVSIVSSHNVLDSWQPFSLENYVKSKNLLSALNTVREFYSIPGEVELTVNDINFGLHMGSDEPSRIINYFSFLKNGCNVTGGKNSDTRKVHILDHQIELWYFLGHNFIHVQKPDESYPTKSIRLGMKEMDDVIESFHELVKDSKEPRTLHDNYDVDISIDYINNSLNCGKISLLAGGKKNYLPETIVKPVALKDT